MQTENQLTAAGLFLLAIVTSLCGALPVGIVFMLLALYYLGKDKRGQLIDNQH